MLRQTQTYQKRVRVRNSGLFPLVSSPNEVRDSSIPSRQHRALTDHHLVWAVHTVLLLWGAGLCCTDCACRLST